MRTYEQISEALAAADTDEAMAEALTEVKAIIASPDWSALDLWASEHPGRFLAELYLSYSYNQAPDRRWLADHLPVARANHTGEGQRVTLTTGQIRALIRAAAKILDEEEAYGHAPAGWTDAELCDLAHGHADLADLIPADTVPRADGTNVTEPRPRAD